MEDYKDEHTFDEISDNGLIRNHHLDGGTLYGIDVVVHPDYRHMKIGKRLYEARRNLCKELNLKNIIFGGRIPNYHKYADKLTAKEYVKKVMNQEIFDPVLVFQLNNGFELKGVIPNYIAEDDESMGYAVLLEWKNPDYREKIN